MARQGKEAHKGKVGRPEVEIDWDAVDKLLQIQCTGKEIASLLNVGYSTLERACKKDKKKNFEDYSQEKRASGLPSLRRRQWTKAMDGDSTMLIWLGKQYLEQTDKKQTDLTSSDGSMSPPDQIEIVAAPFPDDFDQG